MYTKILNATFIYIKICIQFIYDLYICKYYAYND